MGISFITTQLIGMKVPTPYLVFCDITLMELRELGYAVSAWWGWQSRLPTWPLLVWMWWGHIFFFFQPHIARREQLLIIKVYFFYLFCFVAPFLVLWLKEHAFGGLPFFICAFWHIWVSGFLYPCLVYMEQCKNPGNSPPCHSLGPEFPYLGLPSL